MQYSRRFWRSLVGMSVLCSVPVAALAQSGTPQVPAPLTYSTDTFPTMPVGGAIKNVATAAELQPALDSAHPGDQIVLQAGSQFPGSYRLPVQCGTDPDWILIRTSNMPGLPPLGERVDPADAGAMPKILANVNPVPALKTQQYNGCYAQKYWIVGIEITVQAGLSFTGDLVELGALTPSGGGETDPAHMARNIYLDRCYVHGAPSKGPGGRPTTHGIRLEAASLAIVNSYISDFQDTVVSNKQGQAILAIDAIGPIQITNNYIEGSGENALFGGNDPATCHGPAGCQVISDITFTRNTVRKPLYWKQDDPSFVAGTPRWCIGNLFELKNAQRVLVDGNDFEYTWWTGCDGNLSQFAVQFTPRNQDGGDLAATVQDVTFTNNYLRHASGGFNILGRDDTNPSQVAQRILISNNVVDDISTTWNDGSNGSALGRMFQLHPPESFYGGGPAAPDFVTIDHNTLVNNNPADNSYVYVDCSSCNPKHLAHFTFTNNIVGEGKFGVMGTGSSPDGGGHALSTFNTFFDATVVFTNNVIVGATPGKYTAADGHVGDVSANLFPATWDEVGFQSFNNGSGGNYRLRPSTDPNPSPYLATGTGGSADGADVDAVDAHQTGSDGGGGGTLPAGWTTADVGATGLAGSASFGSGTFTVNGAGADIWGTADSFRFVYQTLTGDGQLIAHVASFTGTTSAHAKAGIMIRSTLDTGAASVTADFEPGEMEFLGRQTAGGTTIKVGGGPQTAPAWLKIVRSGGSVSVFHSTDGVAWIAHGSTSLPTGPALIGLAVCSHDVSHVATATFDQVSR